MWPCDNFSDFFQLAWCVCPTKRPKTVSNLKWRSTTLDTSSSRIYWCLKLSLGRETTMAWMPEWSTCHRACTKQPTSIMKIFIAKSSTTLLMRTTKASSRRLFSRVTWINCVEPKIYPFKPIRFIRELSTHSFSRTQTQTISQCLKRYFTNPLKKALEPSSTQQSPRNLKPKVDHIYRTAWQCAHTVLQATQENAKSCLTLRVNCWKLKILECFNQDSQRAFNELSMSAKRASSAI